MPKQKETREMSEAELAARAKLDNALQGRRRHSRQQLAQMREQVAFANYEGRKAAC